MHLDNETIQRLLHGQLDEPAQARRRLADCAECRHRLEEARQEEERIFGLLGHLDHAVPPVNVTALTDRARRSSASWPRWAATILLALAVVGTAYAVPGSPLRAWLERLAQSTGTGQRDPEASLLEPAGSRATAGVSVAPGPRFTIRFTSTQATGQLSVSQGSGPNIVVQVLNDSAAFAMEEAGLVIDNRGSAADYQVELPGHAAWIEIRLGERRLLLQQGGRVTGAAAGSDGRFVLPLASARP